MHVKKNFFNTIFIVFFIFLSLLPSHVPDEIWFLGEAYNSVNTESFSQLITNFFMHKNAFGYGPIWWQIYTFFCYLSKILNPDINDFLVVLKSQTPNSYIYSVAQYKFLFPLFAMRLLSYFSFLFLIYKILNSNSKNRYKLFSVILILTSPMLLWSGKIASPDLFAAGFFGVLIFDIYANRINNSTLYIAILCVSIKISFLPFILCLLILNFIINKLSFFYLSFFNLLKIFIFLVFTNLYYFVHPIDAYNLLKFFSHLLGPEPDKFFQAFLIVVRNGGFWELTSYGSFLKFIGGPVSFFCIFLSSIILLKKKLISSSVFIIPILLFILQFIFGLGEPAHGWYWFPCIIAFLVMPVFYNTMTDRRDLKVSLLLVSAIFSSLHYSLWEVQNKLNHTFEIINYSSSFDCIDQIINKYHIDTVHDLSTIGVSFRSKNHLKINNYQQTFVKFLDSKFDFNSNELFIIGYRVSHLWGPAQNFLQSLDNSDVSRIQCGLNYVYFKQHDKAFIKKEDPKEQKPLMNFKIDIQSDVRHITHFNSIFTYPIKIFSYKNVYVYDNNIFRFTPFIKPVYGEINVFIKNLTGTNWFGRAANVKYPISVSYHIIDLKKKKFIYESIRTPIINPLNYMSASIYKLKFEVPPPGKYILRATVVQDGVSWFDNDNKNYIDIPLDVYPNIFNIYSEL